MMTRASDMILNRPSASQLISGFCEDDSGATAIEYGLIVSLIFLAIVTAVKGFGASTNEIYNEIETEVTGVG